MNGVDMLTAALAFVLLLCCFTAWDADRRRHQLEDEMRELRERRAAEARRRRQFDFYRGSDLRDSFDLSESA